MSSLKNPGGIAALLVLAALLSGCAAYHCDSLPNRAECYVAYEEWAQCRADNRWLIRQVGLNVYTTCYDEPRQCGKKGKCWGGHRRCDTRHEPIYDYTEYNIGVSQCMRQQGLAAYDIYFNRPLFGGSGF